MKYHVQALCAACFLLVSCASSPLDTTGVNSGATPSQAVEAFSRHAGQRVQWGGRIVSIVNEERTTSIEVLSYPVGRDGFPNTYKKSTGRFVLRHRGFLEPRDYAPGRILTVVGKVDSLITTSLGDTRFLVPLIHSEQLKLWADKYDERAYPRFGFGVGIGIGL